MEKQIDICATCVHDEPGYCSVIGTIPHCCSRHWHCEPGKAAKDYVPKQEEGEAKEFGPRIGHVHLKDIRPDMMEKAYAEGFKFRKAVLEGCFTIPGDGCVDYPGVFKALHDAHYEGWFIVEAEQDPAKANPLEYAKMAREYIKKTAGI